MGSGFKVRGRFNRFYRFYRFNRFPILHERRILIYLIKTPRRFYVPMRRTNISHFSFLVLVRLSIVIKGARHPIG